MGSPLKNRKQFYVNLGAQLRKARITSGLSQEKAAIELGVTFQQVQKYERGKNRVPVDSLISLAALYGMPVTAFIVETNSITDNEGSLGTRHLRLISYFNRLTKEEKEVVFFCAKHLANSGQVQA